MPIDNVLYKKNCKISSFLVLKILKESGKLSLRRFLSLNHIPFQNIFPCFDSVELAGVYGIDGAISALKVQ